MQILRRGSEGEEVVRWQRFLIGQGLLAGSADGVFGGSVRELVPIAHEHGFYWGGHFSRRDGMHFEATRV